MRSKRLVIFIALFLTPLCSFASESEVTFWYVGRYDEVDAIRDIAELFRQETGITVKVQPVPWGNFETKFFTAMASGSPPDAGAASLNAALDYGKVGGVWDLADKYPKAVARLKDQLFEGMWPNNYYEGHLFAIPMTAAALLGFYRKDIFAMHGLSAPETWSQLEHVLDKLAAQGYQYGFLWTRNTHWGLGTFTWPFGAESFVDNGTRVGWTEPGFLKGYAFAAHLWNSYDLVIEKDIEQLSIKDPREALPLFFNYHEQYSLLQTRFPEMMDKIGIFPFPAADDGIPLSIMGGRSAVVFRLAKNPDGAMQWLEYLMSSQAQLKQYRDLGSLEDRAMLSLSPNKAFWQADLQMRYGEQALFYEVFSRLQTRAGYPWMKEPERLLEQSLYKTKETLSAYLAQVAARHDISVRELKRRFAAGEMSMEKAAYREFIETSCRDLMHELTPFAQAMLDQDRKDYQKYYGHLVKGATERGTGWDILDYSELGVFLLCLFMMAAIVTVPSLRRSWQPYLYVSPAVLSALVFILIPVIVSFYLSFTKYNPVTALSAAKWIGLENYRLILDDTVLWQSLGRSAWFAVLVIPVQLVIGVVLAALLDQQLWPDRFFKFIYFSPLVTSVVSVSLIWYLLFAGAEYGWMNSILLNLGVTRDPIVFLKDKAFFLNCVIVMTIWQGLAFTILIYLAGFQDIPTSHYEAAEIDGAGPVRRFFSISLPGLRPQIIFLTVMGTIGAIQVFEQIYMLGGGSGEGESKFGPDDSGMTIVPFIYRKGFEYFKMGEASAVAYVAFVFLLALTVANLKLIMRKES